MSCEWGAPVTLMITLSKWLRDVAMDFKHRAKRAPPRHTMQTRIGRIGALTVITVVGSEEGRLFLGDQES